MGENERIKRLEDSLHTIDKKIVKLEESVSSLEKSCSLLFGNMRDRDIRNDKRFVTKDELLYLKEGLVSEINRLASVGSELQSVVLKMENNFVSKEDLRLTILIVSVIFTIISFITRII